MKEIFQSISEEEKSILEIKYEPSYTKLIAFSPFIDDNKGIRIKSLKLEIDYNGQLIIVKNQIGDEKEVN